MGSMSAPNTDTISHLDFDHEQPCEHTQHATHHPDEPAMFYVSFQCPKCGMHRKYFICLPGWERLGRGYIHHRMGNPNCGHRGMRSDFNYKILRVLSR